MSARDDFDWLEEVLAEHTYGEFLGCLGKVWTTCRCGDTIDVTFGDGRSAGQAFAANWARHVAAAIDGGAPEMLEVLPCNADGIAHESHVWDFGSGEEFVCRGFEAGEGGAA